ncbi:uncharacterized protein nell3 [Alosa sapidissima]|uniref:uncharacterized protein nell3 n=1 Tax=Alosa sapidissima TaxID=34773 RepID=UPI001C0868B9|nr:uncharacterized protein nell3 [Alosa sapidissima]XP_041924528.1 uncharacterized protein nell3 [Alosa sapidissima]
MLSCKSTPLMLWCLLSSLAIVGGVAEICRGTHCFGSETGDPRPCSGPHCPVTRSHRPSRQHNPTTQLRSSQVAAYHQPTYHNTPPLSSESNPLAAQRERFADVDPDGARTVGFGPGCTGADCHSPQRHLQTANDTRDCKGIECKLPLRIRLKPRPRACAGDGCLSGSDDDDVAAATSHPTLVHMPDRAAQFLGDLPDFGNPVSDQGSAPLGVQLTCDIKPGENEVPSEDALILHLQLAKGQEKLVEALRSQQTLIRDLQQRLADQQGALLAQQREILDQQRRMSEQMDVVKAQYGLLAETLKQASFQGLQGELQSYFESHLAGLQSQARSHLHKSYAVHKVDVDAKVMDVPGGVAVPLPGLSHPESPHARHVLACPSACGSEEYCDFQREPPSCESCTMCPPGFFLVSQCSPTADRLCQDRDECLELPKVCGERVKCLNTPGGFRCLGVSEREVSAGLCGHEYFYNRELQECQACSDCDGAPVAAPCTATSDTVCGPLALSSDSRLSQVWSAASGLPSPRTRAGQHVFPGLQLSVRGGEATDLLQSSQDGQLTLRQHGLLWVDHNVAVKHSCRNYLQVGVRLNGSEEEVQDLSSVRLEQPERKRVQGVSVSVALEVEPNHTLSLFLRSPNQHCNNSRDLQAFDLSGPSLSLLWLSHDTGAVAMTAHMTASAAHYQTSYRPSFRVAAVSDAYMLALGHDGRGVRFTEAGVVKFVVQQALYAMGHTCVREGFSLVAYVTRNGSSSEVARAFKSGVNYRDTSVTLSGAARVGAGDSLSFELLSPAQCSVRYFGDSSGVSILSVIWIPPALASALSARIARAGLPSGAVRNKALLFQQLDTDPGVSPPRQVRLAGTGDAHPGRNFVFGEDGTANVAVTLKLIHSCSAVKLTLYRQDTGGQRGHARGQVGTAPLAQQVSGHMPEGSEWASVGLRTSFTIQNGTGIYVTLDCVRGRINQISQEGGPNMSILWVAL